MHANILVNYLIDKGHSITLIVPESQKPENSLNSQRIMTVKNPYFITNQARWISLSFSFSKAIRELESDSAFDLIHFTDVRESFFCNTKTPIIGNINDTYSADIRSLRYYKKYYSDWFVRWLYYFIVHQIESVKLSKPSYLIANSQFTLETIKTKYPSSNAKLALCYKSVDIDRYANVFKERKFRKTKNSEPVILFIGGNMQRKGIYDIINASPSVIKQYPSTRFIVVGGDKAIDNFKDKARKLGVYSNFLFTGWCSQEKIIDYYKDATLFIMPSLTEALGVTFLEAMAAGVPVIGTNIGGIPEIIKDGENGRLVPVNSPEAIAKTINQFLSDKPAQKRMTEKALETVQNFSIDNMMSCTMNVYKKVLSK